MTSMQYEQRSIVEDHATLVRVVVPGQTTESQVLEFKKTVNIKSAPPAETARDIAQFANTWGGCLLIGVDEGGTSGASYLVAVAIDGVSNADDIIRWIEGPVRNCLYPTTLPFAPTRIPVSNNAVVAVNVPALDRGVAGVLDPNLANGVQFPYRTVHGKSYLPISEVEERMGDHNRALELRFRRLVQPGQTIVLHSPVKTKRHETEREMHARLKETESKFRKLQKVDLVEQRRWQLRTMVDMKVTSVTHDEFTAEVCAHRLTVPWGLVREIWTSVGGKIALMLSAPIVCADESVPGETPTAFLDSYDLVGSPNSYIP